MKKSSVTNILTISYKCFANIFNRLIWICTFFWQGYVSEMYCYSFGQLPFLYWDLNNTIWISFVPLLPSFNLSLSLLPQESPPNETCVSLSITTYFPWDLYSCIQFNWNQWVQKFLVGDWTHPRPQTQHAHISLISFGNQLKTTEV